MEAERRDLKERNQAFQELFQDINDLNSLMKQIAVEVHDQQEGIGMFVYTHLLSIVCKVDVHKIDGR